MLAGFNKRPGVAALQMVRPLIGIVCCQKSFGAWNMLNHAVSDTYVRCVDVVIGRLPLLVPTLGERCDIQAYLNMVDGVMLTGSRSNVEPTRYAGAEAAPALPHDPARDAVTLPMARACVEQGVPLLAICRGMQELNVALGGTLDPRIQDLPGRLDHSSAADQSNMLLRTARAHRVRLEPDSVFARMAGTTEVSVNSLHNQGLARLAPGMVVEGRASDGTIEAVRIEGAPGYVLGVQWHPEHDAETDPFARAIFTSFGDAARARAARRTGTGTVARLADAAD